MANCLVLGGNGLIGSFVADRLAEKGCSVKAFDRFEGKDNLGNSGVEKVKGDYLDGKDVKNALDGIDLVFHCIHTTVPRNSMQKPVFDAETNILPTVKLLQDAAGLGAKKIVYLSSLAVYGNPEQVPVKETAALRPVSPYGVSKLAIEEYVDYFGRVQGLEYAILRPAAAYGERQHVSPDTGVVANFIYNAINGKPLIIYGNGSAERDLLHADDIARGAVAAGFAKARTGAFNLGAGKGVSLNGLAEKVGKAAGKKLEVRHVERSNEVQKLVCDISKANKELGWKPEISLDEGLKRCFVEFKKRTVGA